MTPFSCSSMAAAPFNERNLPVLRKNYRLDLKRAEFLSNLDKRTSPTEGGMHHPR